MSALDETLSLEERVVALLKKHGLSVSTAESCTGGLLSGRIINVPGASDIIGCAIVTYSNDAKRKYLGVRKSTLKKHGAVSSKCAKEMAKGICKETGASVGLATTGIAGPDGGTDEKPVGLVYIGCCVKGKVSVRQCNFSGDRQQVRQQTVEAALELVLSYLPEICDKKRKRSLRRKDQNE